MIRLNKWALHLFVIFFAFNIESRAQDNLFERLSVEDGLASNYLNGIIQDNKGFLWIATNNGLSRYDGYQFKNIVNDANDSSSISNNWITCVLQDSRGDFWLGTEGGGLNFYNSSTGKFKRFLNKPDDASSISHNNIISLYQDSKGRIWVGSLNGLSLFNPENETFTNWKNYMNCDNCIHWATSMVEDKQGNLWVGDESLGLFYFNTTTHQFSIPNIVNKNDYNVSAFFVYGLYLEDKLLYITTAQGFFILNTQTNMFLDKYNGTKHKGELDVFTRKVYAGGKNDLWITTNGNGVIHYKTKSRDIEVLDATHGLSSNSIGGLLVDYSNNLWVATKGGGLNKYNLKNQMFSHWVHEMDNKTSLANNEVRAIHQDADGTTWVGTNFGLSRHDPGTNNFKNYIKDFDFKDDVSAPRIRMVYREKGGDLWVSSQSGALYRYLADQDRFIHDPVYASSPLTNNMRKINCIYEKSPDILWLCSDGMGILAYNKLDQSISKIVWTGKFEKLMVNLVVTSLEEKSKDELWLGTNDGLFLVNTNSLELKNWQPEQEDETSIVGMKIRSLYQQDDSTLWVGTRTGLAKFEVNKGRFQRFTTSDGLPSDIIFGILPDQHGNIWLSTPNGLSRIKLENNEIKNFTISQNNALDMGAHAVGVRGDLLVGGSVGVTIFDPADLKNNTYVPDVVLTEFKVNNEIFRSDKTINRTDTVYLNYDQNNVSMGFAALEFTDPKKNQFKYKMEGLNDLWIENGNSHSVSFTNLNPGTFVFRLLGSNNDGVWADNEANLVIIVAPPWWATWWFRTFSVAVILTILWYGYQWRENKIKEDKITLNQKIAEATDKVLVQNQELQEQKHSLEAVMQEVKEVVKEVVESGNLKARIDASHHTGEWREFAESINAMFESVVLPFEEINKIVGYMSQGDLTQRYDAEARGDIREVADKFNMALDIIDNLLKDIVGQVESIGLSSNDMLVNAEEMNGSTGEIASSISEMSGGAQQQVYKVDQSSQLIESLLQFSNQVNDQASIINEATQSGAEMCNGGMKQIGNLDAEMKVILDYSSKTNLSINSLSRRSEDINSVLRIIKDIAAQTNLLALNAAIEAAQAGDAGRGFAVVAEEIRKLAEDSKKSAGEIEHLISGVQGDTAATVGLIAEMSGSIKKGEEATKLSMSALEKISQGYNETLDKSKMIVAATEQQTKHLRDIVGLINEIVVIAEQTAAGTEQTASSATELSAGMENYTKKSQQVSAVTIDLKQKVDRFKLTGNS
ncbi:methyl-accepting chemotaxis protein [Reichenbachiella agarivorans]|uniref:Methyl-accepting chemotaxis protein n=1 Tax=Reichenbachiella agarivorans TaxID=2979464 RepID=A0ABY6CPF3_9BACT|nr:two-component regulator propeller domain-containing protein [Reichenbachiella agarivorans]UXP32409.1 methyl-accepting chemotaxis protein [Reichenbachiella agarivorans]